MRIDIKSKKRFNKMLKKIFGNNELPLITGCSINSKNIKKGDIFFALKGENLNGHDFIDEAIRNGASLVLTDEERFKKKSKNINVKNVLETLKKLAVSWRSEIDCSIIGITGSNGKTSTKEILNRILTTSKSTMFTESNYNSTIGLPMSIFSIASENEIAILEMGANKPGEIKELCEIATPNYGIVTNISNAHNEYFGTIENIAKNKIKLLESLPVDGFAFINMDSPYLKNLYLDCAKVTYGFSGSYDFSGEFLNDSLTINGDLIKLPYPNMAIAQNYLATYSISSTLDIDKATIIAELENSPIYPGRGEIIKKNDITFINDTYNSNLLSCINGINSAINMSMNKKILVLADMHELGDSTKKEHVKLGEFINSVEVDIVFGFGEYIKYTLDAINSKKITKQHYKTKKNLIQDIKKYYENGDIVYVKGSRCMKMEEIIYGQEEK